MSEVIQRVNLCCKITDACVNYYEIRFWLKDIVNYFINPFSGCSRKVSNICNIYKVFFKINYTFVSNTKLKLAKNQAKAKQHSEAELLLFKNYLLSSSMLSSNTNLTCSKPCQKKPSMLVLSFSILALGSKSTSLSPGFLFMRPGCTIWLVLFCVVFFVVSLSLLILWLPLLGLGSKPTNLSPEFCVCRPMQYDMICWEFHLFSGFFVSF